MKIVETKKNAFFNFVFDFIKRKYPKSDKEIRVLDFGCGDGAIVKSARECGYNFYGCDNFYEGKNDYIIEYDESFIDLIGQDDTLPYENDFFDFIYSNQVFEHIKNLDTVLPELNRVLKGGG